MAGVDAESKFVGQLRRLDVWFNGLVISEAVLVRKRFGVQFDAVCARGFRAFYHIKPRIDENRCPDAVPFKFGDDVNQVIFVRYGIPTRIGRDGTNGVGHERDLFGLAFKHQIDEIVLRIAFDVELGVHHRAQIARVLVADVPLVRARMNRDAVGAKSLNISRDLQKIGHVTAAGVPQRSDFVDVYAEFCHVGL